MPRKGIVLAALVSAVSWLAHSQGVTGSITGMITDPNGGVIPKAKVVARNVDTSAETTVLSAGDGSFIINNLPPGQYSLAVTADGFRRAATPSQRVTVGGILREDVALELGQVSESVTVETHATQVNTVDAQLGAAIVDIPDLPILSGAGGRNALDLTTTLPGTVSTTNVASQAGGPFAINGARAQSNNYLLDGGDDNDQAINVPTATTQVSPNALSEFRLVTGSFNAEYGRNSGAILEVNTKSGTNEFHGIASETFRNTKLNATPFFQNAVPGGTASQFASGLNRRPQWNTNDWDANVGGPIQRNKTFFFASYLGFRRREGEASAATVPSEAQRAIIESQGTPAAKALLNLVPLASVGNQLFTSPTDALNRDQGLVRADHYFTERHELSATYFVELSNDFSPFAFGGGPIPGFGNTDKANIQNAILRDAYTLSPTLFNEARVSFHRLGSLGTLPVNKTSLSSLGLGAINPDDPAAQGPPNVRISGFSQFGNTIQGPQDRYDDTFQYSDSLSWTHGKHDMKFGGEGRVYDQNQIFDFINSGIYIIDGSGVENGIGNPIAGLPDPLSDFANGFSTLYAQNSAARRGYRTHAASVFGQDNWKISRRLTMNFGLRWEYNSPLVDLNNDVNTFRSGEQSAIFPTAPVGLVFPGDRGVTPSTYRPDWKDFGPRLGFAWDVLGNGKLSVRGGGGIFYDAPITELTLQFLTSPPFAIQPNIFFTPIANPFLGSLVNPIANPFPFHPVKPGSPFDFTAIAPIGLTIMDPNFRTPRSMNWNLQVQYQLPGDWIVSAAYVATKGTSLLNRRNIDYAIAGPGASTANTDARRVFNQNNPQDAQFGGAVFGGITDQLSDANSIYNSLQITATHRFSHGFYMTHAYTWSHAIDDASGLRTAANVFNYAFDRGNSDFDVRHRYVGSYIWEIPYLRGQKSLMGTVLGGWGIAGITTFQSGLPFDIFEPDDRCLCDGGDQHPDFIGGQVQFYNPRSDSAVPGLPNSFFNGTGGGTPTAAGNPNFARVGSGTSEALGAGRYGTLGRNVFHGPGLNNWDFAAFKRFNFSEKRSFEFRSDFFNLFNHTQFANPVGDISSPSFGQVQTTQVDPRRIQLSAKFQF
jgi:hypothetical protein